MVLLVKLDKTNWEYKITPESYHMKPEGTRAHNCSEILDNNKIKWRKCILQFYLKVNST